MIVMPGIAELLAISGQIGLVGKYSGVKRRSPRGSVVVKGLAAAAGVAGAKLLADEQYDHGRHDRQHRREAEELHGGER